MTRETPGRLWGALALVVIAGVAVFNLVRAAQRVRPPSFAPDAPKPAVVRLEERFAAMRDTLAQRNVPRAVRYLADLPPPQLQGDHASMEEYFAAQFALVPWVLDAHATDATSSDWIVANLRRTTLETRAPAGFRVVQDFGGGVWLLQRVPRP